MSKYDAVYFVGDNQAINRVGSTKTRNRGAFSGSLAALMQIPLMTLHKLCYNIRVGGVKGRGTGMDTQGSSFFNLHHPDTMASFQSQKDEVIKCKANTDTTVWKGLAEPLYILVLFYVDGIGNKHG